MSASDADAPIMRNFIEHQRKVAAWADKLLADVIHDPILITEMTTESKERQIEIMCAVNGFERTIKIGDFLKTYPLYQSDIFGNWMALNSENFNHPPGCRDQTITQGEIQQQQQLVQPFIRASTSNTQYLTIGKELTPTHDGYIVDSRKCDKIHKAQIPHNSTIGPISDLDVRPWRDNELHTIRWILTAKVPSVGLDENQRRRWDDHTYRDHVWVLVAINATPLMFIGSPPEYQRQTHHGFKHLPNWSSRTKTARLISQDSKIGWIDVPFGQDDELNLYKNDDKEDTARLIRELAIRVLRRKGTEHDRDRSLKFRIFESHEARHSTSYEM